ncbi:hypothetical protein NMG60_11030403 [Bertholletia excelsa]
MADPSDVPQPNRQPQPTISPLDIPSPPPPPTATGQTATWQNINITSPRKALMSSSSSSASSPGRPSPGKHPLYRGIRSRSGKWVSEIREPKKTNRIWLGTYPTAEMAAAAYDAAALALRGSEAVLNFPDRVNSYPVPESSSPKDIRTAAAAAAARMMTSEPQKPDAGEGTATEEARAPASEAGAQGHEFIDEEALFDMPNLLVDMAGGMLMSPPRMGSPPQEDSPGDSDGGESLWSYD